MADKIDIVIEGIDNATKEIKQVSTSVSNLDTSVQKSRMNFTEFNSAIGIVKESIQLAQAAYENIIAPTVEYGDAVREVMRLSGQSAETASRLIQVSDDLKISQVELGTAMKAAVRKGVDVSVEGLAKLSDEYLKLEPGLERSKFLMDNFGRSGVSMAEMMEQGADGIREMSDAIDDNMIMTDDAVKATRDYEIAMDNLGDAVTGVKYEIGNQLVPVLTDATNTFMTLVKWSDNVNKAFSDQEKGAIKTSKSYQEYAKSVLDARIRTGEITAVQRDWILSDIEAGKWSDQLTEKFGLRSEAGYEVARSAEAMDKWDTIAANSARALADSEDELKQKFSDLDYLMKNNLSETFNKYSDKQIDLINKAKELSGKIGELESKSYLTDAQKTELASLHTKLDETKSDIEDNEAAYKKETQQFILNTTLKYMALDGLSAKDLEVYTKMADNFGLIDEPTKNTINAIGKITSQIDTSKRSADDFAAALSGIPNKDVYVTTHYVSVGGRTGGHEDTGIGGYANGGFTPGGTVMVGERGPELVDLPPGSYVHTNSESKKMASGGNKSITLVYSPMISLASQAEVEKNLLPMMRKLQRSM